MGWLFSLYTSEKKIQVTIITSDDTCGQWQNWGIKSGRKGRGEAEKGLLILSRDKEIPSIHCCLN